MTRNLREADSWRRMVLQAAPPVAWLASDAPQSDVVLSTRCRLMRNLVGHRFPHSADMEELRQIALTISAAVTRSTPAEPHVTVEPLRGITLAERDYLVGCRLVSPDFAWQDPGRVLFLNKDRSLAIMVNEEDHLRVQALTPGWSMEAAKTLAETCLTHLAARLEFATAPDWGFLSASPHNCGSGRRLSAMFHLIGLAQAKRLPAVLLALAEKGLVARGLFGESSRAVGAFVQVSITRGEPRAFAGACEYLVQEERQARQRITDADLGTRVEQTLAYVQAQRTISLADALRVLAWMRWAAVSDLAIAPASARGIDLVLTKLELRSEVDPAEADEQRAEYLRKALGL